MSRHVVLFGGTFDPPHIGHLTMAQLTLEQTGCDEIWFTPAPLPPHKLEAAPMSFDSRVQLVRALIGKSSKMSVCTIEAERDDVSYTVDTVRLLHRRYPFDSFSFLLGADSLDGLPTWHKADELCERINFIVASRVGFPFDTVKAQVQKKLPNLRATAIEMPMLDVSSRWIRGRQKEGRPLCGLLPEDVHRLWLAQLQKE